MIRVRQAEPADVGLVLDLIRALAEYERLTHELQLDEAALREHLFGTRPCTEVLIGELDGEPVGYALYFHTYSTFLTKPGIWLEDLFVRPESRGRGVGRALLARLAAVGVERGCGRLEWSVLDWNATAIGFYRSIGARPVDGWTTYRLVGPDLAGLATAGSDQDNRDRSGGALGRGDGETGARRSDDDATGPRGSSSRARGDRR